MFIVLISKCFNKPQNGMNMDDKAYFFWEYKFVFLEKQGTRGPGPLSCGPQLFLVILDSSDFVFLPYLLFYTQNVARLG